MSISFTTSIITRLNKEMADAQKKSVDDKKKKEKALAKIKQLQKNIKVSSSPSDLSSKLTQINKLNEVVKSIDRSQADLSKLLHSKKAELEKYNSKNSTS